MCAVQSSYATKSVADKDGSNHTPVNRFESDGLKLIKIYKPILLNDIFNQFFFLLKFWKLLSTTSVCEE